MIALGRNDVLFARIIRAGRWVELLGVLSGVVFTLVVEHRLQGAALRGMENRFHIVPQYGQYIIAVCAVMIAFNAVAEARGWEPLLTRASKPGLAIDLIFITAIVALSDGVQSVFFGLYFFAIIGAAIWFGVRGALTVAVLSTASMLVIEGGEYLFDPLHGLAQLYAKFGAPDIFARLPYLFLVAWLTGAVTDAFNREAERRLELERTSARLQAEQERLDRDMEAARQVQESLLPSGPMEVPGLQVAVRYLPAGAVGGDIYDFIRHTSSEVAYAIADVSGHSLPAALLVAAAKGALHDTTFLPPAAMMEAVNRRILRDSGADRFVTMIYIRLDVKAGQMVWVNAGHPPPLLYHAGRPMEPLLGNGLVLGVSETASYEARRRPIEAGDFLVLYSDGLVERHNETGRTTGLPEFLEAMATVTLAEGPAGEDAEDLARSVLECADTLGAPRDDVALLVVKVEALWEGGKNPALSRQNPEVRETSDVEYLRDVRETSSGE